MFISEKVLNNKGVLSNLLKPRIINDLRPLPSNGQHPAAVTLGHEPPSVEIPHNRSLADNFPLHSTAVTPKLVRWWILLFFLKDRFSINTDSDLSLFYFRDLSFIYLI